MPVFQSNTYPIHTELKSERPKAQSLIEGIDSIIISFILGGYLYLYIKWLVNSYTKNLTLVKSSIKEKTFNKGDILHTMHIFKVHNSLHICKFWTRMDMLEMSI